MTYRFLLLVFVVLLLAGCSSEPPPPLNVVVILVDDLGWADTGVYGSTFYETPNIDRLAETGMRFTHFYAAGSVCSPTRASIMTGKHPARLHLTNWIGGEQAGRLRQAEYVRQLPLEEVTLAEAFREGGYATAFIGKWHLGDSTYYPEHQGFDVNIGGHHAGQPGSYFYPYHHPRNARWDVPGLAGGTEGEYLTDRLTDEALDFLGTPRETPFLLFLSYYTVHTPLQAKPELEDKYARKAALLPPLASPLLPEPPGITKQRQDNPTYAAMVASLDENVGRLMDGLNTLGLSDSTVVVFVSDNGGLSTLMPGRTNIPTSNRPLRAGKGWLYEGGIRVPLLVRWPEKTEPGAVSNVPASTNDLYPTLLEMAELPLRPQQHRDGKSLAGTLQGNRPAIDDTLYWHFPHYHGSGNLPSGAIRAGGFKLIEWFEDGRIELYNLRDDPGEERNLAPMVSGKAQELHERLQAWREAVDAQMPTPNPDWRREEGGERSESSR